MDIRPVARALGIAVALAVALQPACRPVEVAQPEPPAAAAEEAAAEIAPRGPPRPEEAALLVGRYCPETARGRPAVEPMFALAGAWYSDPAWLRRVIAGGGVRQLSALGWDGRRVGVMTASGAVAEGATGGAKGGDRPLLVGSYFGSSPCAADAPLGEEAQEDAACVRVHGACGVAVGKLEKAAGMGARPFGEDGEPLSISTGSACIADDVLVVDLHGRGLEEARPAAFPLAAWQTPAQPPAELLVSPDVPAACAPAFASEASVGALRVDVLAVADFDGSGRMDVLLAAGEGAERRWVLYSATSTPARLDRVAIAPALEPAPAP
jgi:hypothetical protein